VPSQIGRSGVGSGRCVRVPDGGRILLVLPLLTWLIQLLNTAVYWVTMSNGHAGRDLG
jgi:hypothetical protein